SAVSTSDEGSSKGSDSESTTRAGSSTPTGEATTIASVMADAASESDKITIDTDDLMLSTVESDEMVERDIVM
nr:hypothetical protein [Tanacetum cinerariifolium]